MDTKALKKQLGAAIAMVLVAAVALGSSTYAWFVSNNTVTATTSTIYAQSNSAYLVIDTVSTSKSSKTTASVDTNTAFARYPAQWANNFDTNGDAVTSDIGAVYQFESAYASQTNSASEKEGTRFVVGDADAAAKGEYAKKNTFYIGTGGYAGIFSNLKVAGFSVTASNDSKLSSAMRALVKCGDSWVVVKPDNTSGTGWSIESQSGNDGIIKSDEFGKTSSSENNNVQVDVYVYYDGSDSNVYSDNLNNLSNCNVTLTFEATPKTYSGKTD